MARTLAGAATLDVAHSSAGATTLVPFVPEAALDRELDTSAFPDGDAAIARYRAGTAAARAQLAPGTTRYGARPREALDIYAPPIHEPGGARSAPVMVYIHGGGWRAL